MKNKIGWCDMTWNPVWGCRNHCEYCYARKIAKRFYHTRAMEEHNFRYWGNIKDKYTETRELIINKSLVKRIEDKLNKFVPTFSRSQFDKKLPKKPQRIFVGSMSEIYYWREEWIERVIEKVKEYPQHTFQFLTRYPEIYSRYIFPKNCWLGVTITREKDFERGIPYLFVTSCNITFVSVEPILEYINPKPFLNENIDWVIIGAETGNRKGKVIPNGSWIFDILNYCNNNKIPVYIKDNVVKYYSEYGGYKQFPVIK